MLTSGGHERAAIHVTLVAAFLLGTVSAFLRANKTLALAIYVFIVAAQATFIHANVRWELRSLRRAVVTPAFHHWHHAAERDAIDKNLAVHTPIWDWLFGTYSLPERWPSAYGLHNTRDVPSRWASQLLYPFKRRASGRRNDA